MSHLHHLHVNMLELDSELEIKKDISRIDTYGKSLHPYYPYI